MNKAHRAPVGHVDFKIRPDRAMHFIWQCHDHQFRRGHCGLKVDRLEPIGFRKSSTGSARAPTVTVAASIRKFNAWALP